MLWFDILSYLASKTVELKFDVRWGSCRLVSRYFYCLLSVTSKPLMNPPQTQPQTQLPESNENKN